MNLDVRVLLAVGLLTCGCSREAQKAPPTPVDPDGWQCFQHDPAEGTDGVAYVRQRVVAGRVESDSVFTGGASRLVLAPVGDHLEATVRGVKMTGHLLVPDGTHWTVSFEAPKGGQVDEDSVVEGGILTVTSMQGGARASARYVPVSCDAVVAALAQYPS